jgi:hypothetical protein
LRLAAIKPAIGSGATDRSYIGKLEPANTRLAQQGVNAGVHALGPSGALRYGQSLGCVPPVEALNFHLKARADFYRPHAWCQMIGTRAFQRLSGVICFGW